VEIVEIQEILGIVEPPEILVILEILDVADQREILAQPV
jgi:hypothetical protein